MNGTKNASEGVRNNFFGPLFFLREVTDLTLKLPEGGEQINNVKFKISIKSNKSHFNCLRCLDNKVNFILY